MIWYPVIAAVIGLTAFNIQKICRHKAVETKSFALEMCRDNAGVVWVFAALATFVMVVFGTYKFAMK